MIGCLKRGYQRHLALFCSGLLFVSTAGASSSEPLGSRSNPVKCAIVPAGQAAKALDSSKPITQCIEKESGLYITMQVPNSYIAVTESMGSGQIDLAFGDISSYLIARKKYNAQALLQVRRYGTSVYQSMLIVRTDSPFKTLKDLDGKRFAYSDASSASSYLLPTIEMKKNGFKFLSTVPTGSMDAAITALLQNKVDAAGVYFNEPEPSTGKIRDARMRVLSIFPNIDKDTRIIWKSNPIPNEPVFIRNNLPEDVRNKLKVSIPNCIKKFPGVVNHIDDLTEVDAKSRAYDDYIAMLEASGLDIISVFSNKH